MMATQLIPLDQFAGPVPGVPSQEGRGSFPEAAPPAAPELIPLEQFSAPASSAPSPAAPSASDAELDKPLPWYMGGGVMGGRTQRDVAQISPAVLGKGPKPEPAPDTSTEGGGFEPVNLKLVPHTGADRAADFVGTAAVRGLGGLGDFLYDPPSALGRLIDPSSAEHPTPGTYRPGTTIADALMASSPRNVEFQPQTGAERIGLSAAEGAIGGAPFGGVGALLGAAGGTGGQSAAEAGLPHWMQVAAALAPAALGKPTNIARERMAPVTERAVTRIGDLMQKDAAVGGKTVEQIGADLGQEDQPPWYAPKPLNLSNVSGPIVRGEAERVAQLPGESSAIAKTTAERQIAGTPEGEAGAATRLTDDVTQALGGGDSAFNMTNKLGANMKAKASPLYKEAFDHPGNQAIPSPEIDSILQTPAGQDALAFARKRMQNAREPMGGIDKDLTAQARETGDLPEAANNAPAGVSAGLSLRALQYVKEALDGQWKAAKMDPQNASAAPGINDLRRSLLNEMDANDATATYYQGGPRKGELKEPGKYAQARKVYSNDLSAADAVEEGAKIFQKHPDQVAAEIGAMDPGDANLYRAGAGSAARDLIAKQGAGPVARKIVGKSADTDDWMARQLRPLFANDGDFQTFMKAASQEKTIADTANTSLGNSATFRRAAQQQATEGGGGAGQFITGALATAAHEPFVGIPMMARAGIGKLREMWSGLSPELNTEIARILYETDPGKQKALIQQLMSPTAPPSLGIAPVISGAIANQSDPRLIGNALQK